MADEEVRFFAPSGAPVSTREVEGMLAERSWVLAGEVHDQACDHRMQAWVLATMASHRPVALGLEMVSVDQQATLDAFSNGEVGVEELPEALGWDERWGVPFSLYAPIFEVAAAYGVPVFALNLPRELVRSAARLGLEGLGADERARLPPLVFPAAAHEAHLRRAWEAHGEHVDGRAFDRFLVVQSLWDSQMAREALLWGRRLDRPVLVLAGTGHMRNGWGIPWALRALDERAEALVLMPWRGDTAIDPDAGDLFFLCPASH